MIFPRHSDTAVEFCVFDSWQYCQQPPLNVVKVVASPQHSWAALMIVLLFRFAGNAQPNWPERDVGWGTRPVPQPVVFMLMVIVVCLADLVVFK